MQNYFNALTSLIVNSPYCLMSSIGLLNHFLIFLICYVDIFLQYFQLEDIYVFEITLQLRTNFFVLFILLLIYFLKKILL